MQKSGTVLLYFLCYALGRIFVSSETEAKLHVAPPWARGKHRTLTQMIWVIVIIVNPGGGGNKQGFYHEFGPAVQGFQ